MQLLWILWHLLVRMYCCAFLVYSHCYFWLHYFSPFIHIFLFCITIVIFVWQILTYSIHIFFFTTGWVYDKCSRVPRKAWAKERGREKGQYCSYTYRTNFYLHAHNATLGSAVTYSLIIPGCLLHIMQIGRACIELRMSGKLKLVIHWSHIHQNAF